MKLIFETSRPNSEDAILILTDEGVIMQGHYYFSEMNYYTHDGELIEDAQGWCDIPEIELE